MHSLVLKADKTKIQPQKPTRLRLPLKFKPRLKKHLDICVYIYINVLPTTNSVFSQLIDECLRIGADWLSRDDLILSFIEILEQVINLYESLQPAAAAQCGQQTQCNINKIYTYTVLVKDRKILTNVIRTAYEIMLTSTKYVQCMDMNKMIRTAYGDE